MANPKPENNVQHFLAKIAGVETSTPVPQTTEEYYLEKIAEGGGGGGGGGTNISLNIEGASVGDIIKVKTVGENGKPTAWEAEKSPFSVESGLLCITFEEA